MDTTESSRRRLLDYFDSCNAGTAEQIAAHFTPDAVVWDANSRPARGPDEIGPMWVKVRERWGGAVWSVLSTVVEGDRAAVEWTMDGAAPESGRTFTFRGSDHYEFHDGLIREIRQWWTFDPTRLDTGLVGHPSLSGASRSDTP